MSQEPEINVEPLANALTRFRSSLDDYRAKPETPAFRDSVVIHFVIVYNLVVQLIFRYVRAESIKIKHAEDLTLSRVTRRALELGVIRCEWEQFVQYSKARNTVAHIYSEAKADEVIALAPQLLNDATFLLETVRKRADEA